MVCVAVSSPVPDQDKAEEHTAQVRKMGNTIVTAHKAAIKFQAIHSRLQNILPLWESQNKDKRIDWETSSQRRAECQKPPRKPLQWERHTGCNTAG